MCRTPPHHQSRVVRTPPVHQSDYLVVFCKGPSTWHHYNRKFTNKCTDDKNPFAFSNGYYGDNAGWRGSEWLGAYGSINGNEKVLEMSSSEEQVQEGAFSWCPAEICGVPDGHPLDPTLTQN